MEVRHTISDPRPISLNALKWKVEIYRNGVNTPIDTIVLSDESLPPRTNKRGKIVWRLPTETGKLPSFGSDERRRIMDLFKEKKKTRRKKGTNTNKSEDDKIYVHDSLDGVCSSFPCDHKTNGTSDSASDILCGHVCEKYSSSGSSTSTLSKRIRRKKDNIVRRQVFFSDFKLRSINNNDDKLKSSIDIHSQPSKVTSKPPGFETVRLPLSPPGFHSALSYLDLVGHDDAMTRLSDETIHQHESHPNNLSLVPSATMRYIMIGERNSQEELFSSASHQSKYHQLQNKKSLAVVAAKEFVDLYYPHITHGLSSDLAMHYTSHAQKSVSVGGAHSVVTGRADIIVQITSLAGTVFIVRGVVAQDTHDLIGAHVLVTGVVQTATLSGSFRITPFAHSIVLTSAAIYDKNCKLPYAFQIHNDALSLMTNGE